MFYSLNERRKSMKLNRGKLVRKYIGEGIAL